MIQKQKNGFTLIELLVVISIMVLISTILIANYNGQRGIRNLKIAQNQLVTNIRKTQSYILSARDVAAVNGSFTAAKYYALKLDKNSNQYVLQSIDKNYLANNSLETITLPQGIVVSDIQYITADGVAGSPASVQVAYASPYAKPYIYSSNDICQGAATLATVVQDPSCMLNLADRHAIITLKDQNSGATKTVVIYGISGKVEATP
jgi:prepilin-type N-terminal cleavage/methylation domain-containing protein